MSNRWKVVKKKQNIYNNLTGENLGSREFFKNDNKLDNQITIINVSAQANYDSQLGGIYTEAKTFEVIVISDFQEKNNILDKTKRAYGSMMLNGDSFNPQFQKEIERKTNVNFQEIRGFEQVKNKRLTSKDYDTLAMGGIVTNNLDKGINFSKNKKGKRGKSYCAELDLTEFR